MNFYNLYTIYYNIDHWSKTLNVKSRLNVGQNYSDDYYLSIDSIFYNIDINFMEGKTPFLSTFNEFVYKETLSNFDDPIFDEPLLAKSFWSKFRPLVYMLKPLSIFYIIILILYYKIYGIKFKSSKFRPVV